MDETDELIREFLVESRENLDRLDGDLLALEDSPEDRERIASIFRTIHTIKGTCGFLGFEKLQRVTHVGESLLVKMRDGQLSMEEAIASALLEMVDVVRRILGSIETEGGEGGGDYSALIERLTALQAPGGAPAAAQPESRASHVETSAEAAASQPAEEEASEAPLPAGSAQRPAEEGRAEAPERARSSSETSIRVDVELLDRLVNLVGELVLTRNQVLQLEDSTRGGAVTQAIQRLNHVTSELQEGVMKTRMQPIGNVWNKFPRVVRDLAVACGKRVQVVMEGRDTELDKTLLEAIKDPLTHLVRNSVDHGIELPDVRRAAGKPEEGTLLLRAFHEGGQVNIEIIDDGRGIDTARVKAKALEKGLLGAERAARMSDKEAVNLIFLPGLSTAQKVTNISGRGVGMDVVKTNIEKIGGSIDVQSVVGQGTTMRIKIPLTLAIIPALMVGCGNDHYAIPQVNLLELVLLDAEQARTSIEDVRGVPVYRLRNKLLPLLSLRELLGLPPAERPAAEQGVCFVVLQADAHAFGLLVDSVSDTEEIVVKPLGTQLKGLGVFAGATIRGDGRVALILDVMGVAQRGGVWKEGEEPQRIPDDTRSVRAARGERETLLLFQVGDERRMAVSLGAIARLEEIPLERVERDGDCDVVQYREQIMALVDLGTLLGGGGGSPERAVLPVIVHSRGERSVGLVVERILDIVEESYVLDAKLRRRGIRGSAVVAGKVTEFLDVEEILASAGIALEECLA